MINNNITLLWSELEYVNRREELSIWRDITSFCLTENILFKSRVKSILSYDIIFLINWQLILQFRLSQHFRQLDFITFSCKKINFQLIYIKMNLILYVYFSIIVFLFSVLMLMIWAITICSICEWIVKIREIKLWKLAGVKSKKNRIINLFLDNFLIYILLFQTCLTLNFFLIFLYLFFYSIFLVLINWRSTKVNFKA